MDLSHMSDDELLAMYQQAKSGQGGKASKPARLSVQEQIQLKGARQGAMDAAEQARLGNAFLDVNRQRGTGEMLAIPGMDALVGAFSPRVAEMNALSSRMGPSVRPTGSGSTSDKDMALYMRAVPSTNKLGPANDAIVKNMNATAQRRQSYAAFLDRYAAQHGTLLGAQEAFGTQGAPAAQTPARGLPSNARPAARPALADIFR